MRVLFLTPTVPWPPDSGGRIRTSSLLLELATRHEIELHCVARPGEDDEALAVLRERLPSVVPHRRARPGRLASLVQPRAASWFFSRTLGPAVLRAASAGEVDLIHVDEPSLLPQLGDLSCVPGVLHHHKLETRLATELRRLGRRLPGHDPVRTLLWERRGARAFPQQIVCCEQDAALLRTRYPWIECAVVPNGVDLARFTPPPPGERRRDELLFLGTLDWPPNVDAVRLCVREVLPRVRAAFPKVRLLLVGRDPTPEVRALAGEGVELIGPVQDVRPFLRRASALLAPLRAGGGSRLKLVEALACQCPVITSPLAAEGLSLLDRVHADLLADPAALAERAIERLRDPAGAAALARAGASLVRQRYGWPAIAGRLEAAWQAARAAS